MTIRKIGHVALRTPHLKESVAFYRDQVGLAVTEVTDDEAYLRCDRPHHSIVLVQGNEVGVDHLALEVDTPEDVDNWARRLAAAGVAAESRATNVGHGPSIRFRDPSGFPIEIYAGIKLLPATYWSRAVRPRKLGHWTVLAAQFDPQVRFYTDVLGFRVSDWMQQEIVWLRCSADHHGVAFLKSPDSALHHIAWELLDWSELRAAADHVAKAGIRLAYGPGRHGPGNNLFMYFRDADRHINEFYADMLQIWDDNTYEPLVWEPTDVTLNQWGPGPSAEFMAG